MASVLVLSLVLHGGSLAIASILVAYIFVSDWLDGFLARRWDVSTRLGYLLDGLADRASYIALLLVAMLEARAPGEAVFLLILRDMLLYGYRSWNPEWFGRAIRIRWVTKIYAAGFKGVLLLYWLAVTLEAGYSLIVNSALPILNILLWVQVFLGYAGLVVLIKDAER